MPHEYVHKESRRQPIVADEIGHQCLEHICIDFDACHTDLLTVAVVTIAKAARAINAGLLWSYLTVEISLINEPIAYQEIQ